MTEIQLKQLYLETEHGTFTPIYTYDDFVFNKDTEEYEYIGLVIQKTAQDVYDEWLTNKDKPPIVEEDKITILLLNGSTGVLKFEKKDNIVFVTGNISAEQYTIIGNIPSNLYPKENITLNGLIITSEGKILFNKQYDEINGFYII